MQCYIIMKFVWLVLISCFLSGCGSETPEPFKPGEGLSPGHLARLETCERDMPPDETVWISGDQACLRGTIQDFDTDKVWQAPAVSWIVVNSTGGDAALGLRMGNMMRERKMDIIVWDKCHSSCANYLFLGARKKVIPAGVEIMWHGSPYREGDELIKALIFSEKGMTLKALTDAIEKQTASLEAHKQFYAFNPRAYDLVTGSDRTLGTKGSRLTRIREDYPRRYLAGWTPSPDRMQKDFGIKGIVCADCDFTDVDLAAYYQARRDLDYYTLEDFTEFMDVEAKSRAERRHRLFLAHREKAYQGDGKAMVTVSKGYTDHLHTRYDWSLGMMWAHLARDFGHDVGFPERPDWADQYRESQWTVWESQTHQMADLWMLAYEAGVYKD